MTYKSLLCIDGFGEKELPRCSEWNPISRSNFSKTVGIARLFRVCGFEIFIEGRSRLLVFQETHIKKLHRNRTIIGDAKKNYENFEVMRNIGFTVCRRNRALPNHLGHFFIPIFFSPKIKHSCEIIEMTAKISCSVRSSCKFSKYTGAFRNTPCVYV